VTPSDCPTKALASWSRDEVVEALQAAEIPCTPVLSIYEADRFAPLVDRGLWEDVQHPSIESLRLTGIPWRFDSLEVRCRGWADGVGASTDHILRQWLGATDQQLESWHAAGALE
jgi:crotonobetainyl-CoA:carnitine CoA-transferase CaiB-like acyl-CoA transferase